MWFAIKCNSSIKDGAKLLFLILYYTTVTVLTKTVFTFAINAFFALSENVFFSIRRTIVHLNALHKILQAQDRESDENAEQLLSLSKINFFADDYYKIIDWSSVRIKSPPVINQITNQKLSEKLSSKRERACF